MLRRTGSKLGNIIADVYVKIMQGTPMVVLLLILTAVIYFLLSWGISLLLTAVMKRFDSRRKGGKFQ